MRPEYPVEWTRLPLAVRLRVFGRALAGTGASEDAAVERAAQGWARVVRAPRPIDLTGVERAAVVAERKVLGWLGLSDQDNPLLRLIARRILTGPGAKPPGKV